MFTVRPEDTTCPAIPTPLGSLIVVAPSATMEYNSFVSESTRNIVARSACRISRDRDTTCLNNADVSKSPANAFDRSFIFLAEFNLFVSPRAILSHSNSSWQI